MTNVALKIDTEEFGTVQFQDSTDLGFLASQVVTEAGERKSGPEFFAPFLVIRVAEDDWFTQWAREPGAHLRCEIRWGTQFVYRLAAEIEPLRHVVKEKDGVRYDAFTLDVTDWERT